MADGTGKRTGHLVEVQNVVHEGGGEDDLIKDRHAATHQACIPTLGGHGQSPLIAISARPGADTGMR